ncbi:MAG: RNA methyltransferase [Syntrophales bacterium]|jgi:hypothetical protein|nr:RNA methyltransferase [Syntrophales bacterium]MCK9528883.1 RNA methyltransferase [Syntrophales bacterium]MDX9922953.1 RNA methyltransferase [Syntrophales bacterium]
MSCQSSDVRIALLHHPVYNRKGDVVTTAVTNLDVHDISRIGRTFGVARFYIVTPFEIQRDFVGRILSHWREGYGASFNPARKEAFDIVEVRASLEDVCREIARTEGTHARLVATSASNRTPATGSCERLRNMIEEGDGHFLILFGTGWGLAQEVIDRAEFTLEPIEGPTGYNHLSVRSAVSIVMDRLLGRHDR